MGAAVNEFLTEIVAWMRTNVDGTAPYTFDLTVNPEDQVKEGDGGVTVGIVPFVIFGGMSVVPAYGPEATLSEYDTTWEIQWWAYAGAADEYANTRLRAAANLANDVVIAIQRMRNDSVNCPNLFGCTKVIPVLRDTYGDGQDVPAGCGMAYGVVVIQTNIEEGI